MIKKIYHKIIFIFSNFFFSKFFSIFFFFGKTEILFFINFFYNSKFNLQLKRIKKKIFFGKTQNHDVVYFTETEKRYSGNGLKIIYFIQT